AYLLPGTSIRLNVQAASLEQVQLGPGLDALVKVRLAAASAAQVKPAVSAPQALALRPHSTLQSKISLQISADLAQTRLRQQIDAPLEQLSKRLAQLELKLQSLASVDELLAGCQELKAGLGSAVAFGCSPQMNAVAALSMSGARDKSEQVLHGMFSRATQVCAEAARPSLGQAS